MAATLPRCIVRKQPVNLRERIARARNAILDRIEDGYSKSFNGEQATLREGTGYARYFAEESATK